MFAVNICVQHELYLFADNTYSVSGVTFCVCADQVCWQDYSKQGTRVALKVQYPNKKITRIVPMMLGPQGIGKNNLFDVIADIIGKHHFKSSAKPTDFFGEHAKGYIHKLIAVFDENKKNNKWMSRIKSDSANTHMTVNGKNQKPIEMRNVAMIFILSNKKRPVTINNTEENDTRFMDGLIGVRQCCLL